jgi:hypothetical protein
MIDDNCLRRLVYYRTEAEKAMPNSLGLQGIFQTGNELEPLMQLILAKAGNFASPRWRIVGAQSELNDQFLRRYNITGHIDGVLQVQDGILWKTFAVCDIKTCSPHVFDGLSDYDSLAKYPWSRKWRGQLMIYALGLNIEKCCLILVNKQNLFDIKTIYFDLDMQYAYGLLHRANQVNEHVEGGTLPDKINRPDECGRCVFAHHCMPELAAGEGTKILADPELEGLLARRDGLEDAKTELATIERQLKAALTEGQQVMIGNYMITWNECSRKAYSVEACTFFRREIEYIGGNNNES